MKCCQYERHLTNISGTFTVTCSCLARSQLFSLSFLYIEKEPPPARSTPWEAYRSGTSCETVPPSICLQSHAFYTFHTLTHLYLVDRSMVVGYILMVHMCSLMCTNHIDMTAHPPFVDCQPSTNKKLFYLQ